MNYPVLYVPAGDVVPIMFSSYAGSTGASITLTGLAVTDIEIYKDGSVTQRASDAGYTLLDTDGIDFDGITGIHGFSIDTGDNTDAGFYTVGAWFTVVVSAVTVDSQTVNFIAAMFRLMPTESITGNPKVDVGGWLGTAPATPTVAGVPEVDLTHIAGATTNVAALATNVDAILTDTTEIGAAGVGLTNVSIGTAGVDAAALAADALNAIADATLDRNMGTGTDNGTNSTAVRTPRQALRAVRNKVTIAAGTLTVTKEDDATTSWTASVTTTAGNPISGVDPT